jgi:integral membrane protein
VTPRTLYRLVAIAETITWALLITGLVLRATADLALAVTIGGGIHGFVFLAYGATAILVAINQRWPIGLALAAVATAVIPFATIPFDRFLEKHHRLDGAWRTEQTDDPRDATWFDAMVRWMLRHPVILLALVAAAVVAVFATLVIAGPPGGRD